MKTDIDEEAIDCNNEVKQCFAMIRKLVPFRPIVVCLCGSTRFKDEYIEAARSETLAGKIVISVGLFGHVDGLDMEGDVKKMLDVLHLKKIDLADEIFVLNPEGYIGESTRREIAYAKFTGKQVRYLCPITAGNPVAQPIMKPAVCKGWDFNQALAVIENLKENENVVPVCEK
jgi:hypothetical protein